MWYAQLCKFKNLGRKLCSSTEHLWARQETMLLRSACLRTAQGLSSHARATAPAVVRRARLASSSSAVDDALRAALARVAESVAQQDPLAKQLDSEKIPGVRTAGPKMLLRFTCTHDGCGRTTSKIISKNSYENGIVLARCSSCDNLHLIADRLGWFGDRTDIEVRRSTVLVPVAALPLAMAGFPGAPCRSLRRRTSGPAQAAALPLHHHCDDQCAQCAA